MCSTNLGFSVEKDCLGFSVGYQRAPGTSNKKTERLVPASASLPTAGSAFHPWAGRLRFSGEAHPGPATLTQSSSFSCGAGLQSESRLLLCCAPAVYMLAADAAVAAAVFGLEHLISYCNKKIVLVLVWGTSERLVPAKKKQNGWYQRALRCQLRGRPFHPWAGRLRFSGGAHPGPATLTQRSSFSCGAGLQSESRLLLCCAPAVYMLGDAAAVAAAVFGLEHLISYCK